MVTFLNLLFSILPLYCSNVMFVFLYTGLYNGFPKNLEVKVSMIFSVKKLAVGFAVFLSVFPVKTAFWLKFRVLCLQVLLTSIASRAQNVSFFCFFKNYVFQSNHKKKFSGLNFWGIIFFMNSVKMFNELSYFLHSGQGWEFSVFKFYHDV